MIYDDASLRLIPENLHYLCYTDFYFHGRFSFLIVLSLSIKPCKGKRPIFNPPQFHTKNVTLPIPHSKLQVFPYVY